MKLDSTHCTSRSCQAQQGRFAWRSFEPRLQPNRGHRRRGSWRQLGTQLQAQAASKHTQGPRRASRTQCSPELQGRLSSLSWLNSRHMSPTRAEQAGPRASSTLRLSGRACAAGRAGDAMTSPACNDAPSASLQGVLPPHLLKAPGPGSSSSRYPARPAAAPGRRQPRAATAAPPAASAPLPGARRGRAGGAARSRCRRGPSSPAAAPRRPARTPAEGGACGGSAAATKQRRAASRGGSCHPRAPTPARRPHSVPHRQVARAAGHQGGALVVQEQHLARQAADELHLVSAAGQWRGAARRGTAVNGAPTSARRSGQLRASCRPALRGCLPNRHWPAPARPSRCRRSRGRELHAQHAHRVCDRLHGALGHQPHLRRGRAEREAGAGGEAGAWGETAGGRYVRRGGTGGAGGRRLCLQTLAARLAPGPDHGQ